MELKLRSNVPKYSTLPLLIVPYGIETVFHCRVIHSARNAFNRTLWNWNRISTCRKTDVPAFNRTLWNWNQMFFLAISNNLPTFNRTLWNWNWFQPSMRLPCHAFNRTLWNWNASGPARTASWNTFNRTLWNWNYGWKP